jgi:sugar O-acyltransferase (sialic acid O-acetyltransferase NeuD family)
MKQALIGNGGHAREVMAQMGNQNLIRFIDDEYWKEESNVLPLSQFNPDEYEVMIAVGDSRNRFDILQKLPKTTKYFTFTHPTALIMDDNIEIGEGSFIGAYSILTTNIKIGKHALLNRAVHIGHDCKIGSFFSAMPGAIISGNVTIYDCVYLGTNSSVKEKISIHSFTTIGSNATTTKHINESGTYVGVPAKKIK